VQALKTTSTFRKSKTPSITSHKRLETSPVVAEWRKQSPGAEEKARLWEQALRERSERRAVLDKYRRIKLAQIQKAVRHRSDEIVARLNEKHRGLRVQQADRERSRIQLLEERLTFQRRTNELWRRIP
jgi:hypothetical protein